LNRGQTGSQSVAWGPTAGRRRRRYRDRQAEQGTQAWVCTAVAALIVAVRERHRLNYAQGDGDPAPDGSSHAFSPLPGWSAAGVSGGKWAGSGVMIPAAAERHRRRQRDRQVEQGTHAWVCTAAVVALTVAVSALAETPPVLTARSVQNENTVRPGTPLPRCAGSWTERASLTGGKQPVSGLGATAERRGRRPRDRQAQQGTHA
jgi:hypothetical protein